MVDKGTDFPQTGRLDAEGVAARNKRNMWLAFALVGFVVLVGLITIVRLGGTDGKFYYHNEPESEVAAPDLPPGMSPDQAAPPPGLTPEPSSK
ncbi:MAG: hypothetical protein ACRBEQ_10645 [Hyphomonas sp.]